MAEKIEIPGVGNYPLWATEDSLKDLIRLISGSDMVKKGSGGGASGGTGTGAGGIEDVSGASKMLGDAMGEMGTSANGLAKNFGSLYDATGKQKITGFMSAIPLGVVEAMKQGMNLAENASTLEGQLGMVGSGLKSVSGYLGEFGPLVYAAGVALDMYGKLLGQYTAVIGTAIDQGLGASSSLGELASVAGKSGLSLADFYKASAAAGQSMRALGANGDEAAKNFGKLQSVVRNTYGTFGMSNQDMAEASGKFIDLVASSGLKGSDAMSMAAEAQGKSMEEMRKISIATGVSMSKLSKSFAALVGDPLLQTSMKKFGENTADAAVRMARGAASFEAVFGDLGRDLYKQMKQAQAAGLSLINTELGAQMAPFADLRIMQEFLDSAEQGAAAQAHAAAQMQKSIEPNLATLQLLAQQGDKAAEQMLKMYNDSKKFTSMSDEEIAALDKKQRADERLKTLQEKMSAVWEKLYNKLFEFIDIIPNEMFEAISKDFEILGNIMGVLIDVIAIGLSLTIKPLFKAIGWLAGMLYDVLGPPIEFIAEGMASAAEVIKAFTDFDLDEVWKLVVQNIGDIPKKLGDMLEKMGTAMLDFALFLPKKLFEGIKAIGGWVGKLFGIGGSSDASSSGTSNSHPVLASNVDNSGSTAANSVAVSNASRSADQVRAQRDQTDDVRRLVDVNMSTNAKLEQVASNTGQTKDAVERNGSAY